MRNAGGGRPPLLRRCERPAAVSAPAVRGRRGAGENPPAGVSSHRRDVSITTVLRDPHLPPPPRAGFVLFRGPGGSRRVLGLVSDGGGEKAGLARGLLGLVVASVAGGSAVALPLSPVGLRSNELPAVNAGSEAGGCEGRTGNTAGLCRSEMGRSLGTRHLVQTLWDRGPALPTLPFTSYERCMV